MDRQTDRDRAISIVGNAMSLLQVSRTVISAQERQLQSLEMWLNQVEIALEKWDSETEDWQRNYLKVLVSM